MKKIFLLITLIFITSCGTNDDDNNPVLPNFPVDFTIDLNLPLNQDLQFDGTSAFIENQGIKGVFVFRLSENNILAWDAACPHLAPAECAAMSLIGVVITCPCDDSKFNYLNGSQQSGTPYPMKQYRAVKNGNSIRITNF